jgi:hypothetical protein
MGEGAGADRSRLRDDGLLGGSLMPLALIVRLLSRVLLVLGVVFLRRRARGGHSAAGPPPYRTPGVRPGGTGGGAPDWLREIAARTWLGQRMPEVAAGARLAGFALALAAFGSAALVLLSAGTTLAALGPRWVGGVLLGLAALFGLAAVREGVWLRRAVVQRRRRRWVERVTEGGADRR